jgi:hypothetical protein
LAVTSIVPDGNFRGVHGFSFQTSYPIQRLFGEEAVNMWAPDGPSPSLISNPERRSKLCGDYANIFNNKAFRHIYKDNCELLICFSTKINR